MKIVSQRKLLLVLFSITLINIASFAQLNTKQVIVEGNGTPMVLLAGGRWDMNSFSAPSKYFSKNFKVIRMEHFNVQYANEARMLPADYSLKAESEAIGKTLDSMGVHERVILVGWSFGALLALDFALNHPGRIQKLVLYEPPAFWVAKARNEAPAGMNDMIRLSGDSNLNQTSHPCN